jgi:hypothetical protein
VIQQYFLNNDYDKGQPCQWILGSDEAASADESRKDSICSNAIDREVWMTCIWRWRYSMLVISVGNWV